MIYERPGAGYYVTATKVTPHGAPATENGLVGVAVKQKALGWGAGFAEHAAPTIAISESFHLRSKGVRQLNTTGYGAALAAATIGQGVYIRPADNSLRLAGATAAGDLPFGKVTEVVGVSNRGVPAGKIRIDLDQKDTLAAV